MDTIKTNSKIGMNRSQSSIPINLIRQWCYCPRVVYYRELTNIKPKFPPWVSQGEEFHKVERKLWQRRNLSRFRLTSGKSFYSVNLRDSELGLHGIVDMVIETEFDIFPVEFKLSARSKKRGDIFQLTAYAILLAKQFSKPSPQGFLVGSGKIMHSIAMTNELRNSVISVVNQIQEMLLRGRKPDTSATVHQCCNCEYLNFCNDRF